MQLSFQLIWTRSQLESLLHFTEPAHITSGMTVVASAVRVMEGRVVSSLNANHLSYIVKEITFIRGNISCKISCDSAHMHNKNPVSFWLLLMNDNDE